MKKIAYMKMGKASITLSLTMVLLSLVVIAVKGINKNVDFEGGSKMKVTFKDDIQIGSLRTQVQRYESGAILVAVKKDEGMGSEFSLKIKSEKTDSGSDISPTRRQNLDQAFSEASGDAGTLELVKAVSVEELTQKFMVENINGLTGDDSVRQATYRQLADRIKAAAGSASTLRALADAVDPEHGAELAINLGICYPAINRLTVDQLDAILTRYNPLKRPATGYEDVAKQIMDARAANNDFFVDFSFLSGLQLGAGESAEVLGTFLKSNICVGKYRISSVENFSASIASELLGRAWESVLLALIGILIYIWLRFSLGYGAAAVIALFHDVIISLGVFSLFGAELSNPVVAAFLTIVGYSLNDTIVVFDRIRDALSHRKTNDVEGLMDTAINDTLSRTVVTSMTTLFVVIVINLFSGNETLETFSFPLLVGITVGTYSSIFVASPILLWWHRKIKPIA